MDHNPPRIYADTSVFGGPFDEEFAAASRIFFEQVHQGRFLLVTSGLVRAEIREAPHDVRTLFEDMLPLAEITEPSPEALQLRRAYLDAGVVTEASADDALHVAMASVARCAVIVSWNFKHIVHFRKIPLYNTVNGVRGLPNLAIFSPREVIDYEE